MELLGTRKWLTSNSSISALTVDGVNECFTLERPWADGANASADNGDEPTAILEGRFEVVMLESPHWKAKYPLMPHLKDVPGRTHIMIHPANYPAQLLGCIAPGRTKGVDTVGLSVDAFTKLLAKMQAAWDAGDKVWYTVKNAPEL